MQERYHGSEWVCVMLPQRKQLHHPRKQGETGGAALGDCHKVQAFRFLNGLGICRILQLGRIQPDNGVRCRGVAATRARPWNFN